MNLFKDTVVVKIFKEGCKPEAVWYEGYRQAKREALKMINDASSDVYGVIFELVDGTFLKEILL